jgi:uncharacterized protein Yka (UPF0111/DUF47 family)
MIQKSIPQQIYDEFIEELSKNEYITEKMAKSLKRLIESGNAKKKDIVEIMQKEDKGNENP